MSVPTSTRTPSDAAAMAEDRARLYALLANAWRYPEPALIDALLDRGDGASVPDPNDEFGPSVNAALRGLAAICDGSHDDPAADALSCFRAEHARLFGHSVRGTCPPYELEYGRSEIIQQTAELADLSGFYSAFGLDLREGSFERGDHVAVECEFLSILCAKQAWGLREGHADVSETCWDAQRLFVRDHLSRWSSAFAHRVMKADPEGFHGRVAALMAAWLEWECRQFDVLLGPQWLELRLAEPETDAAIDCDTGGCGPGATERLVQLGVSGLPAGGCAT